jgi:predicted transcriptional regulator
MRKFASTTLKLPGRLKQRMAPPARSSGKTPHAWMVEALETHAALAEKRRISVADALAAEKEVERTGRAYPAGDVHRYLHARVVGRKAKRPKPARW